MIARPVATCYPDVMRSPADIAVAMHDNGQSWTKISEKTGLPIPDAKRHVETIKFRRRHDLARSPLNEQARGLLVLCASCQHPRKAHDGKAHDGGCQTCGPERTVFMLHYYDTVAEVHVTRQVSDRHAKFPDEGIACYVGEEAVGCDAFLTPEQDRARLPWMTPWRANAVLHPSPKPSDVKREGYDAGPLSYRLGRGSLRYPAMPQVARKRKRQGRDKRGVSPRAD